MIRIEEFRDLLDAALNILGNGAGRVEMVAGNRRVRVGRLLGQAESEPAVGLSEARTRRMRVESESIMVRAPSVGVVSFRDNRTGRPFVEVGQRIMAGQTLAFISAMDITTKVTAPQEGVVEEVFVEDGDGVEYNAPLLKLLPGA